MLSWQPELGRATPIAHESDPPGARRPGRTLPDSDGFPLGHSVERTVAVFEEPSALRGYAWLVAAASRTCLVVVLETRIEGPGRERALAERLVLLADGTLSSVRPRRVEERVLRAP